MTEVRPGRRTAVAAALEGDPSSCEIGAKVATQFKLRPDDTVQLRNQGKTASCRVFAIIATGGAEDSQIFTKLATAQSLANLPGRISLIQLSVTGTPDFVRQFIATLSRQLPDADVHGVKQFSETEGRIYTRISGLLSATVLLVLLLTSLCVMAGMSNVAIERKNDVGPDESDRRFRTSGRSSVPRRSCSNGYCRGCGGLGYRHPGFDLAWKGSVWRGCATALDCVSFFCGTYGHCFHCQRVPASSSGDHSSCQRVSR